MPTRLCIEPRCPNPAGKRGRCDEHRKQLERERSRRRREATQGVYKTRTWQMRRKQAIERQPLCPGPGDGTPCPHNAIVEEVDHVIPLHEAPELAYAQSNLVARCSECHWVKTARENAHG
jgi:5-methylcytosine-specific restriction endonuclease McrA